MLSLYKLHIFAIVAQTGSFNQAAKRLYLTQSAISQHIQSLENHFGAPLFVRKSTGVHLTPAGKMLLDYARQILKLAADAEVALTDVKKLTKGQLKLGATPVAATYILPPWLQEFHGRYPAFSTSLHTGITNDITQRIIHQQLDLGFVEGELMPSMDFHALPIQEITLYLVVNRDHPWSRRDEINLHELEQARFVMRPVDSHTRSWTEQIFRRHHIQPQIVAEFNDPEAIKRAVISGLGVTILPICMIERERAQKLLYAIPIQEITLNRSLKLIWKANMPFTPISRVFLTVLAENLPVLNTLLPPTTTPSLDRSQTSTAGNTP